MNSESAHKAALDPKSVKIDAEHATANVIVNGAFQKRYVFGIAWKPGHETDWSWQGTEGWLQTEFNAEHAGLEPAQLVALVGTAVMDYAEERAQGQHVAPLSR